MLRVSLVRFNQRGIRTSCDCDKRRDLYVYHDASAAESSKAATVSASHQGVPVAILILLVLTYIFLGGVVFASYHGWSFVDGVFFSFALLGTIGLVQVSKSRISNVT